MLAAFGFGTLGPLARFASDAGVSALTFTAWRSVVALVTLVVPLILFVRAGRATLTRWRDVPRVDRLQLAVMGPLVSGTSVSLFIAFERMSIALVLIVFYSYPAFVALAASRLHHERLTWDLVASITLATSGMILVVIAPQLEAGALGLDGVGIAFAVLAGACQGGYALVAANGFSSVPSFQAATLIRLAATVVAIAIVVPSLIAIGQPEDLWDEVVSPVAWWPIVLAGSVGAALPAVALVVGYRRVGSVRGAILMIFEPVFGVALAAVLLGERPAPLQLVGGLLVLAGAALATLSPRAAAAGPFVEPSPAQSE